MGLQFIEQVFIRSLLCVGHCSRYWGYSCDENPLNIMPSQSVCGCVRACAHTHGRAGVRRQTAREVFFLSFAAQPAALRLSD